MLSLVTHPLQFISMFNLPQKLFFCPHSIGRLWVDMPAEHKVCTVPVDFVAVQFRKVFIGLGFKFWQMSNSSDTNNKVVSNEKNYLKLHKKPFEVSWGFKSRNNIYSYSCKDVGRSMCSVKLSLKPIRSFSRIILKRSDWCHLYVACLLSVYSRTMVSEVQLAQVCTITSVDTCSWSFMLCNKGLKWDIF